MNLGVFLLLENGIHHPQMQKRQLITARQLRQLGSNRLTPQEAVSVHTAQTPQKAVKSDNSEVHNRRKKNKVISIPWL